MQYGIKIRTKRKEKGLTQDELAEQVGVSRTSILQWERGKYPPRDAKNIAALEKALGFEDGELFSSIYSNPPLPSVAMPGAY